MTNATRSAPERPGEVFRRARDWLIEHREDYDTAYRDFRWPELPRFNWALDHFDEIARGNARTALWIENESGPQVRRTFDQLSRASNAIANGLRAAGVKRGDRVLVALPNRVELWETMLAAMKLGAVVCPATMMLSEADLADRIERGRVTAVVADAMVVHRLTRSAASCVRIIVGGQTPEWLPYEELRRHPLAFDPRGVTHANDPCVLYFTSGTTSKPKIVLHTHRSYPVGHLSTVYWLGLKEGDLHFNISSPGWAKHAWSCFFAPWTVGATVFVYNQARFDAEKTLATLVRCRVTTLCAPPTAWRSFILHDLAHYPVALREATSAGEPLNPEVMERVQCAWNLEIREGFGQTESTALIGNTPGQPVRRGSMGRPLPGFGIDTIDADGHVVGEGEVSLRLESHPAGLMAGYFGDPEKTEAALGGAFYRTSDVAARDQDGWFWYVGRADDVFKSSDYRISPFEIESVLMEHPAVAEAAVIESPDARKLYVPKACVILKPGVAPNRDTAASILKLTGQRLAPYKRIRIVEFCDLPKTVSGKIRRAELRRAEAERRSAGTRAPAEFFEADCGPSG
jgi:acetyl-CoA synthetase